MREKMVLDMLRAVFTYAAVYRKREEKSIAEDAVLSKALKAIMSACVELAEHGMKEAIDPAGVKMLTEAIGESWDSVPDAQLKALLTGCLSAEAKKQAEQESALVAALLSSTGGKDELPN